MFDGSCGVVKKQSIRKYFAQFLIIMASEDDLIIACASYIIISEARNETRKRKKSHRRWWMTSLLKSRSIKEDPTVEIDYGLIENFCRMKSTDFETLLRQIGPKISKQETSFREPIPARERLMVTLRFLATGDSYTRLMYTFKISKQLISRIIPEVCAAIIECLKEYVKMPTTESEWRKIADIYEQKWNFIHCLGAIDGRHCALQAPIYSGSDYCEGDISIVLLGIADADYCFSFANVVCQSQISDGSVFKNSPFYKKLQKKQLNLPAEEVLGNRDMKVPFVFVADNAFALENNVMKAYPVDRKGASKKRIFNYRLCRALRVIENVFGIMSDVFRVLRKTMMLSPEKATTVVLTCVHLHNFLRKSKLSRNIYTPQGAFDEDNEGQAISGIWRRELRNSNSQSFLPLPRIAQKCAGGCEAIRNEFAEYFMGEGSVHWQSEYA